MTRKNKTQSFLLRLWQEGKDTNWRATLENPHTGERHGFPDLESLFSFLRTTAEGKTQPEEEKGKRAQRKK